MEASGLIIRGVVFFLLVATGAAQDPCSAVNQAKVKTYGFHPSKLSKQERDRKSKRMDEFWNQVQASGQRGSECVRQLISVEASDTYFLFDGASLLAHLDKSGSSDQSILSGLVRTDMEDVDPAGYIAVALQLSARNIDIGPAANKYLMAPNVTVYLPQHGAYELDRVRGAILLYGSLRPALVDSDLIPQLSSPEQEVRSTAAMILAQNMTEESLGALRSLGKMETFSKPAREWATAVQARRQVDVTKPAKYTRQQMLEKLARLPEMDSNIDEAENKALDNSIYATFTAQDLDALRDGRRKMITGVSNESVEGYEEMSRILLNLINVLDLYPQYRSP
jgi:hypothetical protein